MYDLIADTFVNTKGGTLSIWQHEQMALHYHGDMAKVLDAYDPRYAMAECEALA